MNVTGLQRRATIVGLAMISKFGLRDFKGHRDTQLALGRFTMLVGDNASGKTSVLDALALQASVINDPVGVLRGNGALDDVMRRGAPGQIVLSASGRTSQQSWNTELEIRIGAEALRSLGTQRELSLTGRIGERGLGGGAFQTKAGQVHADSWRSEAVMGTASVYRLRAEAVSAAAYSDLPEVQIEPDGTNTAVVLAAMKLGDDEAFQRVEDGLHALIPSVERVRIRRAKVRHPHAQAEVVGSKVYFDFRGAPDVPGHGASQGTLIVLALLTILHRTRRPDLILLDDLDHALHPRAQMDLVRMIKKLLTLDELQDVQIVATTHSPYVLDELDPSDVHAFALREDGTVASRPLSEHPEAERTRGALKAGQLWSLDPERDWVLRG